MTAPRLRSDLESSSVKETGHETGGEAGLLFFDVRDPRSGASMRLYEHEWLIARRMDGSTSVEDIARWAGTVLPFAPTAADLAGYAKTLADLGFLEEKTEKTESREQAAAAKPAANEMDFSGLDEGATADVRPAVLVAVRSREIFETIERAGEERQNAIVAAAPPARQDTIRTMEMLAPVITPPPANGAAADRAVTPPQPLLAVVATQPIGVVTPPDALVVSRTVTPRPIKPVVTLVTPPPEVAIPKEKSSGGLVAAAVLGLIALGGAYVYLTYFSQSSKPGVVTVQVVGAPKDRVEYFDGKGTVSKLAPVTLSFGDAGRVVDVVGVGVETKAGMTLASLDTYAAMEKELADVRDRLAFYENALRVAISKHHAGDAKKAQAKVDEKKKLQQSLEERIAKARIIATSVGTVTDVLVPAGASVAAGAPVVRIADKRTTIEAKLVAADAKQQRVGQLVAVTPVNGSAFGQAKVTSVEGEVVKLEIVDDAGGAIKTGEHVQLVAHRVANVTRIPAAALTKSEGGADQVFVLVGDVVKARLVNVAERTAADVYLASGLALGDRVVVGPPPSMFDGQKASIE